MNTGRAINLLAAAMVVTLGVTAGAWTFAAMCSRSADIDREHSIYDGRWALVDDQGVPSSYLVVSGRSAKREHAPLIGGKFVTNRNGLQMSWDDGFKDRLRATDDGKLVFEALTKTGSVRFALQAVPAARR